MRKKTLFSLIFTPFLLVSLAVCITVFFLFNERFKHDEAALLTKISSQINKNIIEKTTNYLLPAILISELSVKLSASGVIDINNNGQLESYLIEQIKAYPQLSKVYLGKENGDFIMAHRDNKSFVTKIIYQQNKKEEVKQYNVFGELISATNKETSFDPRARSWYFQTKEEEKAIWTDLYMFFTGKRPGITASYPLFNDNQTFEGVFGVDLELSEISEFLSFQKKYYNSKIIILNYKNEIVAQSGNIVFKTLKDGQIVPMHINEHGDDLIQESYKKITSIQKKDTATNQVTLTYDNDAYLISSISFPSYFGKNWKVMTILPKEKLLDNKVPANIIFYIMLIGITLLILIITMLIVRSITTPIKQLTFDLQRLRYKNVDGKIIKSSVIEVSELIHVYSDIKKLYSKTFSKEEK